MQIKIFTIPLLNSNEAVDELNKFLSSHQIINITEQFVSSRSGDYWTFLVKYILGKTTKNNKSYQKEHIDYKIVLDSATYSKYLRLHSIRKKIAAKEGVPVYNIFLNEELAKIAKLPEVNLTNIKDIKGIGEKRFGKYSELIVNEFMKKQE